MMRQCRKAQAVGSSWSAPVWRVCPRRCIWPAAAAKSRWSNGESWPGGRAGPARHQRLSARHRADGADDARHHRRGVRRCRRKPFGPTGFDAGRSGLPRAVRRRQQPRRAQRRGSDGGRHRGVRRRQAGRGLSETARLADPVVPDRVRRVHRQRTSIPHCRWSIRSWRDWPRSADSASGTPWSIATSPTRGCGACSRSSRCTPVWRRGRRWRSTR